jgi:hypothetical protein
LKTGTIGSLFLALAMLGLLTGCDEEKYSLKFSHYLHVTDMEMTCDECHGELGSERFKPITHETCVDCHDEVESEEISVDTCGICHQEKQLPQLKDLMPEPEVSKRAIFVHTEMLAGTCQECHGSIMAEDVTTIEPLGRNAIIQIRDEAHNSGQACSNCHVDMDPKQAPPDHDQLWMKRHGVFGIMNDASCSVCHAEDSCRQCHSVMEPLNHNNQWRLKTHGVVATWDRTGCMVCHYEDSCQSCHSQASPVSHRGRWAASGKNPTHCYGCHTASPVGEGCVVCHEDGNNVMLHQSFWPPVHDRFGDQLNCYECHNPYNK